MSEPWEFRVASSFTIKGRAGVAVTGELLSGTPADGHAAEFSLGDTIRIVPRVMVTYLLLAAGAGEQIGLFLQGIEKEQVPLGVVLRQRTEAIG